jgi:hypothetical protein
MKESISQNWLENSELRLDHSSKETRIWNGKINKPEKRLKDAELERNILKKVVGIFFKSGR